MYDDSIIICCADKGSGIVIVDAEEYETNINEELAQGSCY